MKKIYSSVASQPSMTRRKCMFGLSAGATILLTSYGSISVLAQTVPTATTNTNTKGGLSFTRPETYTMDENIVLPTLSATSWVTFDVSSQQVLGSKELHAKIEPASLTKIMTAYVLFNAIREGRLSMDKELTVSQKAASVAGFRMFLVEGKKIKVADLLRGMIIQSGNDAAVTLAESLSGSEEVFVQEMNAQAKKIGLLNTTFSNVTGLSRTKNQTTVFDLALLSSRLILDFPEEYAIYKEKEYTYNGITQQNRNRLLFKDTSVDGLKTGHNSVGYCLVASAIRNGRRVVAVLAGAPSENTRAEEGLKLLNWGFQKFEAHKLYAAGQEVIEQKVWKGVQSSVSLGSKNEIWVSIPRGLAKRVSAQIVREEPVIAPIAEGDIIGKLVLRIDNKILHEAPLAALTSVSGAGVFGRAFDTVRLWFS